MNNISRDRVKKKKNFKDIQNELLLNLFSQVTQFFITPTEPDSQRPRSDQWDVLMCVCVIGGKKGKNEGERVNWKGAAWLSVACMLTPPPPHWPPVFNLCRRH